MSYLSDYGIITAHFASNWSTTDVLWPGVRVEPTSGSPFVQFSILPSGEDQMELGAGDGASSTMFRTNGRVEINIFDPADPPRGTATIYTYADTIAAIFRGRSVSGIQFGEPVPTYIGKEQGSGMLQLNVSIPFYSLPTYTIGSVEMAEGLASDTRLYTQTAHGFSAGDWVGFDGSDHVTAQADGSSETAIGVVSEVPSANAFRLCTGGQVTISSHGLTAGVLYLSQSTAGAATSTQPTSGVVQQIGVALDANTILVHCMAPQVV